MASIFTQIIEREVPGHFIWEDVAFAAILDANPIDAGHLLVIPKKEEDSLFSLSSDGYHRIWEIVRWLEAPLRRATGAPRIGIAVEGFGVPHVHIHMVPVYRGGDLNPHRAKKALPKELAAVAARIREEMEKDRDKLREIGGVLQNSTICPSFEFTPSSMRLCQLPDVREVNVLGLTIDRYDEVHALIKRTPGVSVRDADSKESIARYLLRNPGFSYVAEIDGRIVGCALCGHDGRRGYLQHVVVEPAFRRRGIAAALVTRCLDALKRDGILKAHLDVFRSNDDAQHYWQNRGWKRREDVLRYSFIQGGVETA